MKVIALYNIKGGVGKTSTAVNLACLSAEDGLKTVLWDLDSQGASTFYFQRDQGLNVKTRKVIEGSKNLDNLIVRTDIPLLFLIPSDLEFRNLDVLLDDVKKSRKRLRNLIREWKNPPDVLILDCPPGLSLLSENIFHAADILIVPTVPTTLSLLTLDRIRQFFEKEELPSSLIRAFFSMTDFRKSLHKQIYRAHISKQGFLKSSIPFRSGIEKMGVTLRPVVIDSHETDSGLIYRQLWKEICRELKMLPQSKH